jgi:putative ABC transport system permease protein
MKEIFLQAFEALINHRFRATMTMLGIAWGIVAVVMLMAYGNGFQNAMAAGFEGAFSFGTVIVWNGQTSLQAGGERAGRPIRLTEADVRAIAQLPTTRFVSPEYAKSLPIGVENRQTTATVRGVSPEYAIMRSEVAEVGRFINADDAGKHRRVVFIGKEISRKLFGNSVGLGSSIRIAGMSFEVIGVLANKVQFSTYRALDKYSVFIPYTTVRELWNQEYVDNIVFQTISPQEHRRAVKDVKSLLAARNGFDPRDERAITFWDSVEMNEGIIGIVVGMKVLLLLVGALTLMIGGVGVMNIMLVTVTERTREIGTRKALGAKPRSILMQFLLEGMVITFLGGIFGIALSAMLTLLVKDRPFLADLLEDTSRRTDIQLKLSSDVLLAATIVLIAVGLLSGLWPALRAARMSPVDSLRYE